MFDTLYSVRVSPPLTRFVVPHIHALCPHLRLRIDTNKDRVISLAEFTDFVGLASYEVEDKVRLYQRSIRAE
jgi:hypothetical protein